MNKRTKALQIDKKTKLKVHDRQNGISIISGKPITWNECCCHYVSKGRGGLGIEENIVGMTYEEHQIFDLNIPGNHLEMHKKYREIAREHLISKYENWNEENLIYKK